jgi:uncharacterized membrane-anchored protein YitT (DUF2179 family)
MMEQVLDAVITLAFAGVLSAVALGLLIFAWSTFEGTKIGQYFVSKVIKRKEE